MTNLTTFVAQTQNDKQISTHGNTLSILESLIARSCTCKLREICLDKNSEECLQHKNIYAQEMRTRIK